MKKEIFAKAFIESLDKNFDKHSKYFEFEFYAYPELGTVIFEINKCLILGFDRAAITLTNHLLERVLKLALIYNEIGLGPKPLDTWDELFSEPSKKYNSINLGSSIEKCKKLELLTQKEKNILFDTIRTLMRNGFSHADPSEILKDLPNESPFFAGSFDDPTNIKEIKLNQKAIPIFQSMQMDNFAKETSLKYFDFVFKLMKNIDLRLNEKK